MKTRRASNPRVVIYPDDRYLYSTHNGDLDKIFKTLYGYCEDIKKDCERHVDGADSVGIEFDNEEICEHCDAAWTEAEDDYNGGCCDKDLENHPDAS